MTALEHVKAWLASCPCIPMEGALQVDYVAAAPGSVGLYPQGLEEIVRREDVLGNVTVTYRQHFLLYQVTCGPIGAGEQAARLMEFQDWVGQQCLAGMAPVFGDVPKEERIWAEKGKLHSVSKTGTCKYAVQLIVQYQKKIERS